jgi:hypothetical protein
MGMESLGRGFNWQYLCDGEYVSIKDCGTVAFLCYLTGAVGDVYTLTEATTAAGAGAQNLATVTTYYTSTGDTSDGWTKNTQAVGAAVATAASADENCCVFEVRAEELSDGFDYLAVTSTGAGIVQVLKTDLLVQRTPANLAVMGV